jgi:hypothetical protein
MPGMQMGHMGHMDPLTSSQLQLPGQPQMQFQHMQGIIDIKITSFEFELFNSCS